MAEDVKDYPSKPIIFFQSDQHVNKYRERPPEGVLGPASRQILDLVEPILGQKIIIDQSQMGHNKHAPAAVASAKPDGYTLGALGFGRNWQPHFIKVPYDIKKDFTWIAHWWNFNLYWCVKRDAPWKNWRQFIAAAKTRKMRIASPPGHEHVFIAQIMKGEGVEFDWHVRGYDTVPDFMAGKLDAVYLGTGGAPLARSAEAHAIAYTGPWDEPGATERHPEFPDVPPFAELGYPPTFWGIGVVGPAGMPEPIRKKLEDAFRQALQDPELTRYFNHLGWKKQFLDGETYRKAFFKGYDQAGKLIEQYKSYLRSAEEEAW